MSDTSCAQRFGVILKNASALVGVSTFIVYISVIFRRIAAIKLMKAMRLKITEMYTMKVLTPTKAEAFFKMTPKRWAQLVSLITQEPGNAHVAPESDTRSAFVVPNAADDFAADDGSDLA